MIKYAVNKLSVIPVRKEAKEQSEIISQLLFGELCKIIDKHKGWRKIVCAHDDYEGWVDHLQLTIIDEAEFDTLKQSPFACSIELVQYATSKERHVPILTGSSLYNHDGMNFSILKEKFIYNGQSYINDQTTDKVKVLEKCVHKYVNAPYLWGGRSPFGIDCSGFTQVVYKIIGIQLKRDAYQQMEQGRFIDFVNESKTGDLAFFENEDGKITHVGIILPNDDMPQERLIIHSSGRVKIDKIDHYGIYSADTQKYTHKLKCIKRLL